VPQPRSWETVRKLSSFLTKFNTSKHAVGEEVKGLEADSAALSAVGQLHRCPWLCNIGGLIGLALGSGC
jgi:hypothetical protein